VAIRSVFFGTPEFAVPALEALRELSDVVGVVCQPDRPAGRGMRMHAPPVKTAALARGLAVNQPVKVRDGQLEAWLCELAPDVALVAAYGRILPRGVLAAPRHGCINLHASLLPAYRGAAPIQWALLDGQTETGISLMLMDEGMDTGPVFAMRRHTIAAETNAGQLTNDLAALAADMVRSEFLEVLAGRSKPTPQDHARATAAPPIQREQLAIDWRQPSRTIANQIRAFAPAPGAYTFAGGRRLKILSARGGASGHAADPGRIIAGPTGIEIACGAGTLELLRARAEGRSEQTARDLVNGRLLVIGERLGEPPGGSEPSGARESS
jgi:methionyl-tRNA formyltransferase